MKNKLKAFALFLLPLIFATAMFIFRSQAERNGQTINPIIGDISFISKFGVKPNPSIDEDLRIKTHLEYVENLLREKDISGLTAEQKQKRNQALDLLHNYWNAGIFPRNYDYREERKPCFIDKDGAICAVGYLVEQTAGRQTAEKINNDHKYDKILAMKDRTVNNWIESNGFTEQECAMIQPTYGPPPDRTGYINGPHAAISGGLIGINVGLTAINLVNMAKGNGKQAVPAASIIFGLGQVVVGSIEVIEYTRYGRNNGNDYTAMNTLGISNIAMGTTSALIGAYCAITNRKKKNKATALNIYSFPTKDKQIGIGLCLTKRL
ncbi:hypothetical protein [Aurantibacillus circumpalustris]|uniref:hypothetical protein n=1 Tax=Aurantibacillus circumpalustris TaxID=3036359 RepID=UPI00295B5977|nr:hypothetical protein [Aurantibacillus circumpalustris]